MKPSEVEAQVVRMHRLLDATSDCCMSCLVPIHEADKRITFYGKNLYNPLLGNGAKFHDKGKCREDAIIYENLWVQAVRGRRRSLLTLKCVGSLIVHGDGTAECHGRNDGSDCPTVHAKHSYVKPCHASTLGCGRGCTKEGHPGTKLDPRLSPEGYLP